MRARISARSYRWNASPSTMAALIFSRRKMCWNVFVTVVVPAPEEPVIAMTGCLADMDRLASGLAPAERRALVERRMVVTLLEAGVAPGLDEALDAAARSV